MPYLIIIVLVLLSAPCRAQVTDITPRLEILFEQILNTGEDAERLRLNDSVILILNGYVQSDSVMTHRFERIRNLGQVLSPDSKVKIITWNIILRDGSNSYFLYIIRKGEKKRKNVVFTLAGKNSKEKIKTDGSYNQKDWYGALYYAIQPFKSARKISYIILGFDFGNASDSRKIIDVLNFDDDQGIIFGKKCFTRGTEFKYRDVLEYDADGLVSLRINSKKLIVFDHLDPFSTGHGDAEEGYGAGSSYDGYSFKKGLWNFVSNIDVRNPKLR